MFKFNKYCIADSCDYHNLYVHVLSLSSVAFILLIYIYIMLYTRKIENRLCFYKYHYATIINNSKKYNAFLTF